MRCVIERGTFGRGKSTIRPSTIRQSMHPLYSCPRSQNALDRARGETWTTDGPQQLGPPDFALQLHATKLLRHKRPSPSLSVRSPQILQIRLLQVLLKAPAIHLAGVGHGQVVGTTCCHANHPQIFQRLDALGGGGALHYLSYAAGLHCHDSRSCIPPSSPAMATVEVCWLSLD